MSLVVFHLFVPVAMAQFGDLIQGLRNGNINVLAELNRHADEMGRGQAKDAATWAMVSDWITHSRSQRVGAAYALTDIIDAEVVPTDHYAAEAKQVVLRRHAQLLYRVIRDRSIHPSVAHDLYEMALSTRDRFLGMRQMSLANAYNDVVLVYEADNNVRPTRGYVVVEGDVAVEISKARERLASAVLFPWQRDIPPGLPTDKKARLAILSNLQLIIRATGHSRRNKDGLAWLRASVQNRAEVLRGAFALYATLSVSGDVAAAPELKTWWEAIGRSLPLRQRRGQPVGMLDVLASLRDAPIDPSASGRLALLDNLMTNLGRNTRFANTLQTGPIVDAAAHASVILGRHFIAGGISPEFCMPVGDESLMYRGVEAFERDSGGLLRIVADHRRSPYTVGVWRNYDTVGRPHVGWLSRMGQAVLMAPNLSHAATSNKRVFFGLK